MNERNNASDRPEADSLGEIRVPHGALYAAQTQRAVENFPISGLTLPRPFIHALALIKGAAAEVNCSLDLIEPQRAKAIAQAAGEIAAGQWDDQFPVDVFQTGSGTSTNMNVNEVIATRASQILGEPVHPNDHVNMGQSSNDVVPSAIHVSAVVEANATLLPGLRHLSETLGNKARANRHIVKTGRTHLMDALPLRLSQEIGGWQAQIDADIARIETALLRMEELAIGGTAVGTGVNAHPELGRRVAAALTERTGVPFSIAANLFMAISAPNAAVELSGQLKVLACSLMKIANDLRWMNSGPISGLGEIVLPALQPGSSIMPGKINPVVPEAICMVAAQVIGNDTTVTVAGQSGSFQLNVMLPIIAYNLLQSISILGHGARVLADRAIDGFVVNADALAHAVDKNPILVTALNRVVGYDLGAQIAKTAYAQKRPLRDVAGEMTDLDRAQLDDLLDPRKLTSGGV